LDGEAPPLLPHILKPLESCGDIVPAKYCEMLGIPVGSTYAQAVELFAPSGVYELDLHGYSVWEALELAERTIRDAWECGYRRIAIIHGAPDIRHPMQARHGRGGIKWGLRGLLYRGEWNKYVYGRRSRKHWIDDGYMSLALRTHPSRADCCQH
jgi:hypothetical protein